MITIPMTVASDQSAIEIGAGTAEAVIPCSMEAVVQILPRPYTGEYQITPTAERQILQTDGMSMTGDLVIEPIPNNYGLITWNGSFLTVS